MKLLLFLIVVAGAGYWAMREIDHEKDLQSQLDETRQELEEAKRQIQGSHGNQQQPGFGQAGHMNSPDAQWSNPLNRPSYLR